MNFDGSSLGNPGPAGYGGVFRNAEGQILLAYTGLLGIVDSTLAEIHRVLHGLRIFQNHLVGELVVEGDSQNVIVTEYPCYITWLLKISSREQTTKQLQTKDVVLDPVSSKIWKRKGTKVRNKRVRLGWK
ncbi:hypothetical protein H6P81_010306 [Aristolochia fimbriata]|uniref:RNase H type-1 domain-containing protein n=1 Tax=Aristolochia fimbriata TaxID=158543 RepID=A0AAV7ERA1_ARIFI|nr:hypothetical protein H6P81_010306 [Aristolochia fimbriata]